jgi:hypothetical protein
VHNYLYHGGDKLKFDDVSAGNDMVKESMSSGTVAVDLDNDGDLDLVTNNMDEQASVYQNLTMENAGDKKPSFIDIALKYTKANADGIGAKVFLRSQKQVDHQEVQTSTAYASTQNNTLQFTFLPGDKPLELMIIWPDNSYQFIKDFRLNKNSVIKYNKVLTHSTGDIETIISSFIQKKQQFTYTKVKAKVLADVHVFETPDFNYYSLLPHTYLPRTPAIAVSDANKDGYDDIYLGGIAGDEKYILSGTANGTFNKTTVDAFSAYKDFGDNEAQWVDVNNDGLPDLIVLSANNPFQDKAKQMQPRLYINKGNFKFEYKALPTVNDMAPRMFIYDFNGDGLKDVFLTSTLSFKNYTAPAASVVLLNKGNGNFAAAAKGVFSEITSIRYITSVTTPDIDKNGTPDIVITSEWQPVQIFLNRNKKLVKLNSDILANEKGWWQSALITDMDGDGKADLLAGNWGTNNKYNVSDNQPLYAYNNDLDGDGKNDLILSYFYKGSYYPFRPKNDLELELPYIKKEFLSYQKMADKTTSEIFKDKLNDSSRLTANQFSSIFISDILNAKKITLLPYLYQQAPVRSVTALNNTQGDVLLNGNFWGVTPYEGKYDALGLVTLNYNKQSKQFSAPEYWLNPLLNSQELSGLYPIKIAHGIGYVTITYEGKLLLITR